MDKVPTLRTTSLLLALLVSAGCNGGSGEANAKPGLPDITPPMLDVDFRTTPWRFEQGDADWVSAAKVAGYYAVANREGFAVEIRDIHQTLLHSLSLDDAITALPEASLGAQSSICGMTLTPSGRMLYLAVCQNGENAASHDSILAYNLNTQSWRVFDQIPLHRSGDALPSIGMQYFQSALYVGTHEGVRKYDASRNQVYNGSGTQPSILIATDAPVLDIAVDMEDKTLYTLTASTVSRLKADDQRLTPVYQGHHLANVSFSRVFGQKGAAGMYLTQRTSAGSQLLFVNEHNVRTQSAWVPEVVHDSTQPWRDFMTTADGRILYTDGNPSTLYDAADTRLSYQQWLRDELQQYSKAIKSLISSTAFASTNTFSPDGFLHRKIQRADMSSNTTPVADNVGWAIYALMAMDKVQSDPEVEPLIELLLWRHAGLMPDGLGGIKTVDGHFVRNYLEEGTPNTTNPQPQVYTSMKLLPAVIKAAEQYPDNANIQQVKQYLQQVFVRSSDTIRARQGITWEVDDFGPVRNNNGMANETWIYGDLGAAQDPLATDNYHQFVYDIDNFGQDQWLAGEPVIKASHAAFIVMGGTLVLDHHFTDKGWAAQNANYFAATQAETDDLGSPYFAAFSAGNNPTQEGNYYNDGPSDHPGNILHFPAVLGFGQHGHQGAMVGGYMAYRDDRRQSMVNGAGGEDIQFLTRWSMDDPHYAMNSIGIADFWFGAIGLAETLQPGTTASLRNTFFRPDVSWTSTPDGRQRVTYSALTPRLVTGMTADGKSVKLGYQRSPFITNGQQTFTSFKVTDLTADWVELDDAVGQWEHGAPRFINPDFEQGITGWTVSETASAFTETGVGGMAATVETLDVGEASLTQAIHLPLTPTGTQYRVSAHIDPTGIGRSIAYVRAFWSETADAVSMIGEPVRSRHLGRNSTADMVFLNVEKPDAANYLHIEYVVDGKTTGDRAQFDNTALQLIGKAVDVANGGFEDGALHWSFSHGDISITDDPARVPSGTQALLFELTGSRATWRRAERVFDISQDEAGTRYVFRARLGERQIAEGTEMNVDVFIDSDNGKEPVHWPNVAAITAESSNALTFVMRKRPGETQFKVVIKMRQEKGSTQTDSVVIDDLTLTTQRLFDSQACTGSVTGC